jgi:hypothetical protein
MGGADAADGDPTTGPQAARPWLHRKPVLNAHMATVSEDEAAYWLVGAETSHFAPGVQLE